MRQFLKCISARDTWIHYEEICRIGMLVYDSAMNTVLSTMQIKKLTQNIAALAAMLALTLPSIGFAQTPMPAPSLEISGWIPYWRSAQGVANIIPHLNSFTEVNPFMYTVKTDGTLNAASPLSDPEWVSLRTLAKQLNIRFVPAVMWANADAMDTVFRDPDKRKAHISSIIKEVFGNGADGIDIDYESKYAKTAPYFALFLKELKEAIGYNKWITCTIEARTPLDSRYSSLESIPSDIAYANDFKSINQYCDSVRLMTYDQGRIDLKLNAAKGDPYIPVSDADWVEKVVNLAAQDIDKKKLVLGVPTYGYEYDMFPAANGSGKMQYSQLWSFNPGYAMDIASKLGLTPVRDNAGELMLSFPASKSPAPPIPLPNATRVLSWSDSQAIKQKMDLAVKLGVRGIAIFKIDGGQDPALWDVLARYQTMRAEPAEKVAKTANAETDISPILASFKIPMKDLKPGMISEDVRTLQKILNVLGFTVAKTGGGSPGNETAKFGPATQAALAAFQKSKKITPASGYYGPKTREVIKSLQ
jgi:spore germination protein